MNIERAKLTPEQEKAWKDTKTALIWHAPAFSHILYTLLRNTADKDCDGNPLGAIFTTDEAIPTAATDGSNLIFNCSPTGYFRFNLNMRLFILAHEIMHNILGHCEQAFGLHMRGKIAYPDGTTLDFNAEEMNCAQDYVINAILTESNIGEFPKLPNGEKFGLLDSNIATSKDNSMDTYRKIHKKPKTDRPGKKPGSENGPNNGHGPGFDRLLPPGVTTGKDPQSAANDRNQAEWDTEVASAIAVARSMGNLPLALEKVLTEVLEPKVDWTEQIRAWFARKVGSGAWDWKRPDRRLITRDIYTAGRSGFKSGTIVVGFDTSGSCMNETPVFMAEMAGILEDIKPERLVIIWADCMVQRVDEVEEAEDLRHLKPIQGGGTSFVPVFDKIAELGLTPDALVYLTDGIGGFPNVMPEYPVIWGNVYGDGEQYPWGDVVNIPKQTPQQKAA